MLKIVKKILDIHMMDFKISFIKIYYSILCIFLYFSTNHAFSQGAASVEVDPAILQTLNQSIPVIGRIVSLKEAKVPAAVMGRVEKILIEEGDRVEKGQILAAIDTERYKWLANIATANVNAAAAELKKVQKLKQK